MPNTNNSNTATPANQSAGVVTPAFDPAAHQESAIDDTADDFEQTKLEEVNRELQLLAAETQRQA
jgi:hypothetical protein